MISQSCLTWGEAAAAGADVAGGKGWNLGRLWRWGFPVPAGGVLSAPSYAQFIEFCDLGNLILAASQAADALVAECHRAEIESTLLAQTLPDAISERLRQFLQEQGLLARPLTVRSSATCEDGRNHSFAGMHLSCLNVHGLAAVTQAVVKCYASLWSPQAFAYRRRANLHDVRMAVVIQELVPARAAGVAFTCDPHTGRRDRIVISANWGLGESVVQGKVPTDCFVLALSPEPILLKQTLARKTILVVPQAAGGTAESAVEPAVQTLPTLPKSKVLELTRLVLRIQSVMSEDESAQDVEWAWDGEHFAILQARPLTTQPLPCIPGAGAYIWSNANLREVVPGVQSPLSWDHLRFLLGDLIPLPFTAAGFSAPEGTPWVRKINGRVYFNLTAVLWSYWHAFGVDENTVRQSIGGHYPENLSFATPVGKLTRLRQLLRLARLGGSIQWAEMRSARLTTSLWHWVDAEQAKDLEPLTNEQLVAAILELHKPVGRIAPVFQMMNMAAGTVLLQLGHLLERRFPGRGNSLAHALVTGRSEVTSAEHGYRLAELGNLALEDPVVRRFFQTDPFQPDLWLQYLPPDCRFSEKLNLFLKDFGHRGVQECDIRSQRWGEDPTHLLQMIRAQVVSGIPLPVRPNLDRRHAAGNEVFTSISWPTARLVRLLIRRVGQTATKREFCKSVFVKLSVITRRYALEVGRRMVSSGTLKNVDDVFFLSWFDVAAWLCGEWDGNGADALVNSRRTQYTEYLTVDAPDWISAAGGARPSPQVNSSLVGERTLKGLAASSGSIMGKARVLHNLDQASRLQPGEILIAKATDPAWTPLFLRAAALVTESGGLISHAVIVAREYGIPAVVNVAGVVEAIRDGDLVLVDGNMGLVEILASATPG